MKNNKILQAMMAIALVLGIAACSSPSTSGNVDPATFTGEGSDGSKYILTITGPRAAITPRNGDSYVLGILSSTDESLTSTGTVKSFDNSTFELKLQPSGDYVNEDGQPFDPFTVTVSSSIGIMKIEGVIPAIKNGENDVTILEPPSAFIAPPNISLSLPFIYWNGKFLTDVSVEEGEYKTHTGDLNNLRKGKVSLEPTYIKITPAEGNAGDWNEDYDSILNYYLNFNFSKTLDLRGYDGIEVEWEGIQDGWEWQFIEFSVNDAVGKSPTSWGGSTILSFGLDSSGPNVNKGYFKDAWGAGEGWALEFRDFTYKIKAMNLTVRINGEHGDFEDYGPLKIKSVKIIKK